MAYKIERGKLVDVFGPTDSSLWIISFFLFFFQSNKNLSVRSRLRKEGFGRFWREMRYESSSKWESTWSQMIQ